MGSESGSQGIGRQSLSFCASGLVQASRCCEEKMSDLYQQYATLDESEDACQGGMDVGRLYGFGRGN
jgi:hypothetical protein